MVQTAALLTEEDNQGSDEGLQVEKHSIPAPILSSFPDEPIVPETSTSPSDDFKTFQDLLYRVADTLEIPVEDVQEKVPQAPGHLTHLHDGCLVMPIHDGL